MFSPLGRSFCNFLTLICPLRSPTIPFPLLYVRCRTPNGTHGYSWLLLLSPVIVLGETVLPRGSSIFSECALAKVLTSIYSIRYALPPIGESQLRKPFA